MKRMMIDKPLDTKLADQTAESAAQVLKNCLNEKFTRISIWVMVTLMPEDKTMSIGEGHITAFKVSNNLSAANASKHECSWPSGERAVQRL